MARDRETQAGLSFGTTLFGFIAGLIGGGVFTLLKVPRSGRATRQLVTDTVSETGQNLRTKLETLTPGDPVSESIAEGKAAAARRREALGL